MSSSRAGKRKRCEDIKNEMVAEMYDLVITSAKFLTEVEGATEDFYSIFKTMEDRHSEIYSQALGINERYGSLIELIQGKKKPKIGETSSSIQSLPTSYSWDTRKFIDDTHNSLNNHVTVSNYAVEKMTTKFNESVESWNKKIADLKQEIDQIQRSKDQITVAVHDFKAVLYQSD